MSNDVLACRWCLRGGTAPVSSSVSRFPPWLLAVPSYIAPAPALVCPSLDVHPRTTETSHRRFVTIVLKCLEKKYFNYLYCLGIIRAFFQGKGSLLFWGEIAKMECWGTK